MKSHESFTLKPDGSKRLASGYGKFTYINLVGNSVGPSANLVAAEKNDRLHQKIKSSFPTPLIKTCWR
jgi:hypothetical protein